MEWVSFIDSEVTRLMRSRQCGFWGATHSRQVEYCGGSRACERSTPSESLATPPPPLFSQLLARVGQLFSSQQVRRYLKVRSICGYEDASKGGVENATDWDGTLVLRTPLAFQHHQRKSPEYNQVPPQPFPFPFPFLLNFGTSPTSNLEKKIHKSVTIQLVCPFVLYKLDQRSVQFFLEAVIQSRATTLKIIFSLRNGEEISQSLTCSPGVADFLPFFLPTTDQGDGHHQGFIASRHRRASH
ncbi:hypothetical protein VTK73DRAFT_3522 [Phialemonium thermophilum]|uniref:Uncharacterized protein n=1 Tax=Phialemonium thermophilum TaxID=223376 RepID=A0ABR3Y0I0_9PEZI